MRLLLALVLVATARPGTTRMSTVPQEAIAKPPLFRLLTPGQPAALQALGTLAGSRGETITTVRSTTRACVDSAGATQTLAVNTPCVESRGLKIVSGSPSEIISWQPSGGVTGGPSFSMSVAATVNSMSADQMLVQLYNTTPTVLQMTVRNLDHKIRCQETGGSGSTSTATFTLGVAFRASCSYASATNTYTACLDGVCTSATGTALAITSYTHFNIGNTRQTNNANLDGYMSDICLHNNSTRCRSR